MRPLAFSANNTLSVCLMSDHFLSTEVGQLNFVYRFFYDALCEVFFIWFDNEAGYSQVATRTAIAVGGQ